MRHKKKPQSLSYAVPAFQAFRGYAIGTGPTGATEPVVVHRVEDLGLAIEPIVGLRSFQAEIVDAHASTLYSFNGTPWPQRAPLHALCGANPFADHEVPDEHCQCGIYAWKPGQDGMLAGKLSAEVYLWGEVLICDLGYRAEFAYPKSLTITAVATRAVQRIRDGLEEAYGVPVSIIEPQPEPTYEGLTASGGFVSPLYYRQQR